MVKWKNIILHHSAGPDRKPKDWGIIRYYHVKQRLWRDVGYHRGVELVGNEYEVLMGRPLTMYGAHCIPRNRDSIGVCVVGDFTEEPPPPGQLIQVIKVCKELCEVFDIPPARIYPHNEFSPTECPGKMFNVDRVIAAVTEGILKDKLTHP